MFKIFILEERVLLDASVAPVATAEGSSSGENSLIPEGTTESPSSNIENLGVTQESSSVENGGDSVEVLLLSSDVDQAALLKEGVDPEVRLIFYDASKTTLDNLLQQISNVTSGKEISRLGFATDGAAGKIFLTAQDVISLESIQEQGSYRAFFEAIGGFMQEGGAIDFFACNLSSENFDLINTIEFLTETSSGKALTFSSSTNITGSASLGGDFILEQTGFDASAYFKTDALSSWEGSFLTFIVNTTADSGTGSLRQAILDANSNSGSDTIFFDLNSTTGFTIDLLAALPTITDVLSFSGATATINGNNLLSDGLVFNYAPGSGSSIITSLNITGFNGNGITVNSASDISFAGITISNNTGNGIEVISGYSFTIGSSATPVTIIDNSANGIVFHKDVSDSTIAHVDIGVLATSTVKEAHPNGGDGILIEGADRITLGSSSDVTGLTSSGNLGHGIHIKDSGSDTSSEITLKNIYIGTINQFRTNAQTPRISIGNEGSGVYIENGDQISFQAIGWISGNGGDGVTILGGTNFSMSSQFIGGSTANRSILFMPPEGNAGWGIRIDGSFGLPITGQIGDRTGTNSTTNKANFISDNGLGGILVENVNAAAGDDLYIAGNHIGVFGDSRLRPIGDRIAGNFGPGIAVINSSDITIGGIERNVVVGSQGPGILIQDSSNIEVSRFEVGLSTVNPNTIRIESYLTPAERNPENYASNLSHGIHVIDSSDIIIGGDYSFSVNNGGYGIFIEGTGEGYTIDPNIIFSGLSAKLSNNTIVSVPENSLGDLLSIAVAPPKPPPPPVIIDPPSTNTDNIEEILNLSRAQGLILYNTVTLSSSENIDFGRKYFSFTDTYEKALQNRFLRFDESVQVSGSSALNMGIDFAEEISLQEKQFSDTVLVLRSLEREIQIINTYDFSILKENLTSTEIDQTKQDSNHANEISEILELLDNISEPNYTKKFN